MFRPPISNLFRSSLSAPLRPQLFPAYPKFTLNAWQVRGHAIYQPRRVRSRKTHKGVIPCRTGGSTKGTTMQHGEYGLRLIARGRPLSAKQLETADNILRKALKDIKGARIYYRYACGKAVCKKGNEVRMGKGKGTFDHWGTLVPAGKVLFEVSAPDLRIEIAKEALLAAGKAIPGPVQFVDRAKLKDPAIVGLSRTPIFHAGLKVEGTIDSKVRSKEVLPVVISPHIGYEKLSKTRKGLVRR